MEQLLVLIFSGAALFGVGISLVGFLQKVPRQERLAVVALTAVGALLLITIVLFAASATSNQLRHDEVCDATNGNREAISDLILIAEKEHPDQAAVFARAEKLIDGPIC